MLAVSAIVSETAVRAEQLAAASALSTIRLRSGRPGPMPTPEDAAAHDWTPGELDARTALRRFLSAGDPGQVRESLLRRAEHAGADELIVTTMVHDPAERIESYRLLAEAFRP